MIGGTTERSATTGRMVAPVAAAVAGLTVAIAIALVPTWRIESAVLASGLPALLPAAAPPLGLSARIALMLGAGGGVAALLWAALMLLVGGAPYAEEADDLPPVVRRADAHPDAAPRAPVRAGRDLGTPFLEAVIADEPKNEASEELALPRDLDVPMAAFDPAAVPAQPAAPAPTLRALYRPEPVIVPVSVDPEPTPDHAVVLPIAEEPPVAMQLPVAEKPPVVERPSVAIERPVTVEAPDAAVPVPTLAALLARLDEGLARRRPSPRPIVGERGLESALGALRRMAVQD